MSNFEAVYLTIDDIISLKNRNRLIGKGTDGSVYDVGGGYLYKIYHDRSFNHLSKIDSFVFVSDDSDVKIAVKGAYNYTFKKENNFRYYDVNGVRVNGEDAIYRAILLQNKIKLTSLPVAPIYVNSRFKGCVLKKHKFHFDLHKLSFLSMSQKKKILSLIIDRVEELMSYYVYHLDICNCPSDRVLSHSNVLISLLGVPEIIDLDGKSTIYRESEDKVLLNKCLMGLNVLVLEFLYGIDIATEMLDDDLIMVERTLLKKQVPDEYVEELMFQEANFSSLRRILKP